jgi:hypothetical protein
MNLCVWEGVVCVCVDVGCRTCDEEEGEGDHLGEGLALARQQKQTQRRRDRLCTHTNKAHKEYTQSIHTEVSPLTPRSPSPCPLPF